MNGSGCLILFITCLASCPSSHIPEIKRPNSDPRTPVSKRSMTTILTACLQTSPLHPSTPDTHVAGLQNTVKPFPTTKAAFLGAPQTQTQFRLIKGKRGKAVGARNALPDWPLMAVLVEHMEGERDLITHKSIWHLSDETIKNVYLIYAMFTCWGCCFFGSTKDPFYDSEAYRGDGGDGTGNWVYTKQEDIEENARQELLREELIEEIEQKVGGLRELGEAREEELVK